MHKFVTNLQAIVTSLGLTEKFNKKELTAEENAAIFDAYNKAHGDGSFLTDKQSWEDQKKKEEDEIAKTLQALAGMTGVSQETAQSADGLAKIVSGVENIQNELKEAKATINKLSSQALSPDPTATVVSTPSVTGPHTETHAFGIAHKFFSTDTRYNQLLIKGRALEEEASKADCATLDQDFTAYTRSLSQRYGELKRLGLIPALKQGSVDYSQLNADTEIGTRQLTIRQDMVIARIVSLPGLAGIFDTVSNIQSGQVITNVLFTDVSQAYQAGEVFKGNVTFLPEKALVDKAMAKVQFEDMTALERAYINYLNREGSDPVKWNLLEWLILQLAVKLNNERLSRSIIGRRVEPVKGKAGHANFASTGVIHRLISYVKNNQLLPFTDEELSDYDVANFGDVVIYFAKKVVARRPADYKSFPIYLNANHKPMFLEWYRNKFGKDTDFKGGEDSKVPYHEIPIKWVPNMGNLKFIFSTPDGNIQLLQNKPGEEYDTKFERHLEEVIAYSYWMEGAGAGFVGPKYKTRAELLAGKGRDQFIFMNWPAIPAAADATTVDVETAELEDLGFLIKTSANTKATALTDIKNAREGVVYLIECGDTAFATKISKADKFSEIASDWVPTAVGEYIEVYFEGGKFYEVERG